MVHRIESLNAFVACHDDKESVAHHARFAVCQSCDSVVEIDDSRLDQYIKALGEKLNFRIEREMLELIGLCQKCQHKHPKPAV
jgi:Fur family zinc uptake transcriptional regulator